MDTNLIKTLPRYRNFTFLDSPVPFSTLFKDTDFQVVQVHDSATVSHPLNSDNTFDIIGFVGEFEWRDNEIVPLDGDSYTPNMSVIGYDKFTFDSIPCLDILVMPSDW